MSENYFCCPECGSKKFTMAFITHDIITREITITEAGELDADEFLGGDECGDTDATRYFSCPGCGKEFDRADLWPEEWAKDLTHDYENNRMALDKIAELLFSKDCKENWYEQVVGVIRSTGRAINRLQE